MSKKKIYTKPFIAKKIPLRSTPGINRGMKGIITY